MRQSGWDESSVRATGQDASSRWVHIWEFHNGTLVSFEEIPGFVSDIVAALKA